MQGHRPRGIFPNMDLSVTRTIDAPIDRVWALQLDHIHWPEHLPNFSKVVPHNPQTPFGLASVVFITQPNLGTVAWTVHDYQKSPSQRRYTWHGMANGVHYQASHEVEEKPGNRTQLTLKITATGWPITLLGWLLKTPMQKAITAEAEAFERWAQSL